jgi:hypothetical protein
VLQCAEDSVEIGLEFFKTVGAFMQDVNYSGFQMCALHPSLVACYQCK